MPIDPYQNVRFLPIRTVAEQWYRDRIGVSLEVITNELRRGLINLERGRNWEVDGLVPEEDMPPLDELPDADIEIDKGFVRRFAQKQRWPLPRFWFPDEVPPARRGGRPSHMDLIRETLEERATRGELCETVSEEARELNSWAVAQGLTPMQDASVRKAISRRYSELRGTE